MIEVIDMSKQGMKRNDSSHEKHGHSIPPVPELQGKAKHTKTPARPIIAGTISPALKVYHGISHSQQPFPNECDDPEHDTPQS